MPASPFVGQGVTLAEFLLARIDEDSMRAWRAPVPNGRHASCVLPGQALAECESKRAMLELAQRLAAHDDMGSSTRDDGFQLLALLVAPYDDHPDYNPAWRP